VSSTKIKPDYIRSVSAQNIIQKPIIESIKVQAVDPKQHNTIYTPSNYPKTLAKPYHQKSPHARRDRYVERNKVKEEIVLQESLRPRQKQNIIRERIKSKSQTRSKQT